MPKQSKKQADVLDPLDEAEDRTARLEAVLAREKKARRELGRLTVQAEAEDGAAEGEAEMPGAAVIEKVMRDLNGEGSFSVYKEPEGGGNGVKIATYDLCADWESKVDRIVKAKGAGEYSITFRDNNGVIKKSVTRTFDPIVTPGAASMPAVGQSTDVLTLVASMHKANEDRSARLEAALENSRIEMARVQSENTKAMFELVKAQNSGGFFKEIMPLVPVLSPVIAQILKALKPEEKDPLGQIADVLDVMEALKEKNVEPSGTWDRIGSVIASAIAPATAAAMGGMLGARARGERKPAPGPLPTGIETVTPAVPVMPSSAVPVKEPASSVIPSAEVQTSEGHKVIPLGGFIDNCLTAINGGVSAENAAEAIFNDCEKKNQGEMLDLMVEHGDWDSLLTDPRLANHLEWVNLLRSRLVALIEEADNVAAGHED